jgi:hypothetical protein
MAEGPAAARKIQRVAAPDLGHTRIAAERSSTASFTARG